MSLRSSTWVVTTCVECPFYRSDPYYPICELRRYHGPNSKVGEFPHYISSEIGSGGKHSPPMWCLLWRESVQISVVDLEGS